MNKIKFVNQSDLYTAVLEIWAKACDRFMVKGYIRVQPTANSLTYTGVAQALCTAGTGSGTIVYSLDGSTYTTTIPSQTNAGTYTVYYKVLSSFDSTESPVYTLQCSINEKQPTITIELSEDTYTYDGTAKTPTVTVKDGATTIDPSEYTVTYSNNTNAGTATVTITDNVGGNYNVVGSTTFTITPPMIDGHYYVDLGLSSGTKWATMNVGASSETDYGNYYMYGKGSTTYNSSDSTYEGMENPLNTSYDTAKQVMGGSWHMPTKTQCQELIDNTTYTWETNFNGSGINGGKFTASNGNYIFFPAAGYYFNGTLYNDSIASFCNTCNPNLQEYDVWNLKTTNINDGGASITYGLGRQSGLPVRGVVG